MTYEQSNGFATYNRTAAVAYARQFTSNTSGKESYNNKGFNAVNSGGDCANFVSQCLYAGGVPQCAEWYYRTPYTTSGKRNAAWTGTVSQRNFLVRRGWTTKLNTPQELRKGDLVYTFRSEKSLPHVVIVCEDVGNDGRILICGHTSNQLDRVRGSYPSVYYHINDTLLLQSGDELHVGYRDSEDFETAMSDFGRATFRRGSVCQQICNIKKRLLYLGYFTGFLDNCYDDNIISAVRAFQAEKGITVDGVAGPITKANLYHPNRDVR